MTDFREYRASDRERCLAIFDSNTPRFFAPNERQDYVDFLAAVPSAYEVCVLRDHVVGAFGVTGSKSTPRGDAVRLQWILVDPTAQGQGVGRAVMERVLEAARLILGRAGGHVDIAASHLSAPFFVRFGAVEIARIENGWGPEMHRVDMEMPV